MDCDLGTSLLVELLISAVLVLRTGGSKSNDQDGQATHFRTNRNDPPTIPDGITILMAMTVLR
jgi:hypothetical protein